MLKQIASVAGLTFVSRVLGFARDVLTALFLGAGPVADAFFVAFRLPNHFRALLAEGAFNAAFVPLFSERLVRSGERAARRFAEQILGWMIAVQLVLLIAVELAMPDFMRAFAPGFDADPQKFALAVTFTSITFPYLLLISVVALLGGVLNSVGRFGAAAAAPILLNLCLIGAQFALAPLVPTVGHALAWGVAAAGVAQFAYLLWDAHRAGYALRLPWPRLTPEVRRFFKAFGPAALGAGLTQINLFLDTLIASLLPTGAVSYLYYADRLNQLPLGVIGIAVGTVLLPRLSRQLRAGEMDAARASQNRALEWSLVTSLPMALAFMLAASPIVAGLFQWGAFTAADTGQTAATLTVYAFGLPAFIAIKALLPGFYARGDTATPVRVALAATLVNIALKFALMDHLAQTGLALATSVAAWINTAALLVILMRRGQFAVDAGLIRALARLLPCLGVFALILEASEIALADSLASPVFLTRVAGLTLMLTSAAAAFMSAALALDLSGLRTGLTRRLRRQPV